MKWKEIEKKHPKGFELLLNQCKLKYNETSETLHRFYKHGISTAPYTIRDLYDFFDGQKLYVQCMNYYNESNKLLFHGNILIDKLHFDNNDLFLAEFSSRSKAETALFTKCFEILEKQLNEKK